jgi:LPS export ABC transporter protein LptC
MLHRPHIWIYFFTVALLITGCRQGSSTLVLAENAPAQSMRNATIQHSDSGRVRMVTWGEEIWNFDDEDETQEFPKGVKATFYDECGTVTSIITANEATNWQKRKLMNLRGNVIIQNFRDGTRTYTENFYWDQDARRLYSDVDVLQISEDGTRTRGSGFESDEDMVEFRLVRPRITGYI